jgi:hypothetical protein
MCIWKRVYAVQALAWDNIVARPKNVTVGWWAKNVSNFVVLSWM